MLTLVREEVYFKRDAGTRHATAKCRTAGSRHAKGLQELAPSSAYNYAVSARMAQIEGMGHQC